MTITGVWITGIVINMTINCWYTFNFAPAISICFLASILLNSSFLCASTASILAVASLCSASILAVASSCFVSSCGALNSTSLAASSAATSSFFNRWEKVPLRTDWFLTGVTLLMPCSMYFRRILHLLRWVTQLTIFFPVFTLVHHTRPFFVLETVRSVFYCISSQFCCGVPSNGESLLPFLIATTATV